MSNFGGKIQGHKGTKYKNKIAFKETKRLLVDTQKVSGTKIEARDKFEDTPFYKRFRFGIALLGVILFVLIVVVIIKTKM